MQVIPGPAGAGQGPLVLTPPDESLAGVPDVELDPRGAVEAVVLTFEEVVEEALLQVAPVRRVEMRPVGIAVCLEPLGLGGASSEAVEVAPGMDPLAAPVRRREEGDLDPGEVDGTVAMPVVEEGMALDLGERFRRGSPRAGPRAASPGRRPTGRCWG